MEKIRKRGIIGIVVCAILFGIFVVLLWNQNWKYAFKKPIEINNIVELNQCSEGDWIKLHFTRAYGTDYWYEKDGQVVARFMDVEVNGKALIALVEKAEAENMLDKENEEMLIEGIVKTFDEPDMVKGFEGIKQNYLEDFSEELTEEEILDLFTPMQLLSYGEKTTNWVTIIVFALGTLGSGIGLLIAIIQTIKPIKSRQERMRKEG